MLEKQRINSCNELYIVGVSFINNILIKNIDDPLSEPLLNNPMVSKIQLFLPHWHNKGIISIADMIYENGNYITLNDLKIVYHIRTNV